MIQLSIQDLELVRSNGEVVDECHHVMKNPESARVAFLAEKVLM